jgi:hypothetical protein
MEQKVLKKLNQNSNGVTPPKSVTAPTTPKIISTSMGIYVRVHNLQWKLPIKHASETYKAGKWLILKNHKIYLGKHNILVYNEPTHSITAPDIQQAKANLYDFYAPFFKEIADKCNVILQPINLTHLARLHVAEVNNELAKTTNKEGNKLKVRGDDGKVWLLIDQSHAKDELECVHPTEALKDYETVIDPFFKDIRFKPYYLPSQSKAILDTILTVQNNYADAITKHLEAVESISANTKDLRQAISKDLQEYVKRQLGQFIKKDKKPAAQASLNRYR